MKDENGVITHYVSVLKDVTELRKQQEEEFYLQIAHEVQQRFNTAKASLPGFDIAGTVCSAMLTGGDYFDFIVHVFNTERREFYALERLWGNAERVELPDEPGRKR